MTDVIELAKHAGFDTINDKVYVWAGQSYISVEIERFAKLVRNATLEEAAQAAVDAVAFNGGTVQTESHVRQAIESLKEPTP